MAQNTEQADLKSEETKSESEQDTAAADNNVEALKSQLAEAVSFKEKYYYMAADYENYRKRMEREKETIVRYANEKVLSNLLEVVDNLERVVHAIKDDGDAKVKNIHIGVDMVLKQFFQQLKDSGLQVIESVGKKFDPNLHEALGQKKLEGKEDDLVVEEYQKGYLLNGRLLRAAKVVITKN